MKEEAVDKPVTAESGGTISTKKRRQVIRGVVLSDKMNKTRVIVIKRRVRHGLYQKQLARKSKIHIHDEKNESKAGDLVTAVLTRPLSKNKHFRLKAILQKANAEV